MAFHDDDQVSNESANPSLGELLETLSRRRVLTGGLGAAGLLFLGCDGNLESLDDLGIETSGQPLIGFTGVPISTDGHRGGSRRLRRRGAVCLGRSHLATGPAFAPTPATAPPTRRSRRACTTTASTSSRCDSSSRKQRTRRGLLVMNHEYTDDGLLHVGGMVPWTADKVRKSQAAHGVSVDRGRSSTTASGRSSAPRPTPAGSPPTRRCRSPGPPPAIR